MPRNGAGTYTLYPGVNPVVTGTTITSSWANNTLNDLQTAMTASIANDGQTPILANLPMSNFRHTGVGNAAARTDYSAAGQIQDGGLIYAGTVGGTADVITITLSPAITAYAAGQVFHFIASGANTTNVTLNVNGVGAKAVTKAGAVALIAGDIPSGALVTVKYDGTQFQLVSTAASVGKVAITQPASSSTLTIANGKTLTASNTLTFAGTDGSTLNVGAGGTLGTAAYTATSAYAAAGAATASGLTMNTARLLGRTTASSGAIEEITVGSGLSLSGGSLISTSTSGLTLISATTIAGTPSTVDITTGIDSTYDDYVLELSGVTITADAQVELRVSVDGGANWKTSSYSGAGMRVNNNTGTVTGDTGASGFIQITPETAQAAASNPINAEIILHSLQSGTLSKSALIECFYNNSSGNKTKYSAAGYYSGVTTAVNALRLLLSTSTFSGGVVRLYGLKKS